MAVGLIVLAVSVATCGGAPVQAKPETFAMKAPAAAGERVEMSLGGVWEGATWLEPEIQAGQPLPDRTGPVRELPKGGELRWEAAKVPADKFQDKPDWNTFHRVLYRTKVQVPAELKGRSFVLRLPSFSMIASVHVNGKYCSYSDRPYAIWDCDITPAVKPGEVNEIVVAIKDLWYELAGADQDAWIFTIPTTLFLEHNQGIGMACDYPVFTRMEGGILDTPVLIAAGPVYSADVFAIPSVRNRELGIEVTLFNPGAAAARVKIENEAVAMSGGKAEKTFGVLEETVEPGKEKAVRLSAKWENPKLWWPDDPQRYLLVTRLSVDGKTADVKRTPFGFREWQWNGLQFKLNGVPWDMWADTYPGGGDPAEAMQTMKRHGQRMWRFWGSRWCGLEQAATLDFMDAHGMPVRRSGIFDGEFASYNWWDRNPNLFKNWREIIKAHVKGERNHPSIFVWSLENEITFINSRNLGKLSSSDPEVRKTAAEVMALDPTRPVMVDGGNCLLQEAPRRVRLAGAVRHRAVLHGAFPMARERGTAGVVPDGRGREAGQ